MQRKDWKKIIISLLAVVVGQVCVYDVSLFLIGYYAAAVSAGANIFLMLFFTLIGIVGKISFNKVLEYMTILVLFSIVNIIVKRKKGYMPTFTMVGSSMILTFGIKYINIEKDSIIWIVNAFSIIMETISVGMSAIVLKKAIQYILDDKKEKSLEKEEIISMAILITIVFNAFYKNKGFIVNVGVFLFALIIMYMIKKIIEKENKREKEIEETYAMATNEKMKECAESFTQLSKKLLSGVKVRENISKSEVNEIFDKVSQGLCQKCIKCDECWNDEFYITYNAANSIICMGEQKGHISLSDIPQNFIERCSKSIDFVNNTNVQLDIARINLKWENKFVEVREILAKQLYEVSQIINNYSKQLYIKKIEDKTKESEIIKELKKIDVNVKDICIFEKNNKYFEIILYAKALGGRSIAISEIIRVLKKCLNKKFVLSKNNAQNAVRKSITSDYENIFFIEDVEFRVITAASVAIKESEKISGDNYSILNTENGEVVMVLSDGMGNGEKAAKESETVIETLEQFIEAGFEKDTYINMLNTILLLKNDENTLSTVDISRVNLYTGVCDFIKIGASTTFIKRKKWVESMSSTTLPMGIFKQSDYEKINKKLYDGDFVIMLTDGALDHIKNSEKENIMENIIQDIQSNNPKEIADTIIEEIKKQNSEPVVDDITVLVMGIWKK